jgi:hypothetical protein
MVGRMASEIHPAVMKSFRNFGIVIAALAVVGTGVFLWLKHEEVNVLRAQLAAEQSGQARGRKSHASSADGSGAGTDLTADAAKSEGRKSKMGAKGETADGTQRTKAKDRQGWRAYADLVGNPQFEALSKAQISAQVGRTYGALFTSLNLPPDKQAALKELLTGRQQAVTDAVVAARESGLKSKSAPQEVAQIVSQASGEFDAKIQQLIGATGFNQLLDYQAAIPERNLVLQLQQQLATTPNPLSSDQATRLVRAFAQAEAADVSAGNKSAVIGTNAQIAGGGVAKVTPTTIAAADTVLTQPQILGLVEIQEEQALQSLMKGKATTALTTPSTDAAITVPLTSPTAALTPSTPAAADATATPAPTAAPVKHKKKKTGN